MKKNLLKLMWKTSRFMMVAWLIAYCFSGLALANETNAQHLHKTSISLSSAQLNLLGFFGEVERQSEFRFHFNPKLILNSSLSLSKKGDLETLLYQVADQAKLSFKQINESIAVKPASRSSNAPSVEVSVNIRGKVLDSETGEPVVGATLIVMGSTIGTVTDLDGNFELSVSDQEGQSLRVSYIGYQVQTLEIGNQTEYIVRLVQEEGLLDEVVVVGYGEQKKANLTGAVNTIDSKVLKALEVNTIGEALMGQLPGLNVDIADGKPGRAASFNIRGATSINGGGEPLIVIDGVASSSTELNNISPKDIENISVLKDASSAAIYGARGAFGVILVTTKRAKPGEMQVNYTNSFGFSKATRIPEIYDGPEYASIINQFASNIGQSFFTAAQVNYFEQAWQDPSLPAAEYTNSVGSLTLFGSKMTNYYKEYLREYTPRQNHHVSVMGGSEKFSYSLSGDYNHEEGNIKFKPDNINRYSLRSNISYNVNKNISIFNNTLISSRNDDLANTYLYNWISNFYRMVEMTNPYIPETVNVNGTEMHTDMGFYKRFVTERSSNTTSLNGFSTTPGVDISLVNGDLKVHADFTYKQYNSNNLVWADLRDPLLYLYSNNNAVREAYPNGSSHITRTMYTTKSTIVNAYATYDKLFTEKHHVTLIGGMNLEDNSFLSMQASRANPFQLPQHSLNLADGVATVTENDDNNATQSTFFRASYNFDERYMIEANGAYNVSSKFSQGKRDALFLSVSGGWRVSEEDFFQPLKSTINDLKIRASYGSLGNQNIGSYDYLSMLAMRQTSMTLEGERTNYTSSPAPTSSNFTWETSQTKDLGIDAYFLDSRLSFTADIYQRNTKNMLAKLHSLPSVFGATVPRENNAELSTRGWEVSLGWRNIRKLANDDFSYGIRAGISDYTSKIVDYYNPTNYLGDYYIGQTIGEIWGLTNDGYFQTDEEAQNGPLLITSSNRGHAAAGYIRFKDFDNNDEISNGEWTLENPGDFKVIGNTTPRYQYFFTLNGSWKGFDVNAFFRGVGKRDIFPDGNSVSFWGPYARKYVVMPQFVGDNIWTPENPDAYFPRPQAYIAGDAGRDLANPQTKYLQSAAFLRLKNLTLGYTLPQALTRKVRLDKLRFYFVGQNLFEFTKLNKALDPEGLADDPDAHGPNVGMGTAYPMQRVYTFGLELQF